MNRLHSWLLTTLFFVALAAPAAAQTKPGGAPQALAICLPDCENDNFIQGSPFPLILTLPNGCQVSVEWFHRVACGVWYDYQITNIHLLTPQCVGMTAADITNQTMVALLLNNPAGFPPTTPNTCNTNWRVSRATCWHFDEYSSIGGYGKVTPCDANICCLQYYTVCIDSAGNRVVTKTGFEAPLECPPQSDPSIVCDFICS